MTLRLVIITEIIAPYRIPLFNALAERGDVDLHVIFLAETDPNLRQWQVYKEEIRFSYSVLRSRRLRMAGHKVLLNFGMVRALRAARPDVILCGGYNYPASWLALVWARAHSIPFHLWSESNLQDLRGGSALVELLKSEFLRQCSGFVVPGRSAAEYLLAHKIKKESIFVAVNAVDNELFARKAASARQNAERLRAELALPPRYFLFVGRLVREKGVFDLLSAYAKLDGSVREQVSLVFVGDGACRKAAEEQASSVSPAVIRFQGFAQRDKLAVYYALAEALILPTYTDTWGLVVNEAMACGLPVILSKAAGCAADLVTDGWNGLLVAPGNVSDLARAMQILATHDCLRTTFKTNSQERITNYSPRHWSDGVARMMEATGGAP